MDYNKNLIFMSLGSQKKRRMKVGLKTIWQNNEFLIFGNKQTYRFKKVDEFKQGELKEIHAKTHHSQTFEK